MHQRTMNTPQLVVLLLLIVFAAAAAAAADDAAAVYRWASCGGGWRAMFADVGFANALQSIGVSFDNTQTQTQTQTQTVTNTTNSNNNGNGNGNGNGNSYTHLENPSDESSSSSTGKPQHPLTPPTITGMSSTSGATWFSTQFFYSSVFMDIVLNTDDDDKEPLRDFVEGWMNSYLQLTETILENNSSICKLPNSSSSSSSSSIVDVTQQSKSGEDDDEEIPGSAMQWCIIIRYYNGDWAAFVTNMMLNAANYYEKNDGNTSSIPFPNRTASAENRNPSLKETDLIVQTSMAPMSRKSTDGTASGSVFLGPSNINAALHADINDDDNDNNVYFSTVIPTAYTVTSTSGTQFHFGNWSADDMTTFVVVDDNDDTIDTFDVSQYNGYYLYDGKDSSYSYDAGTNSTNRSIFTLSSSIVSNGAAITPPKQKGTFVLPFSSTGEIPNVGQIDSISSASLGVYSGLNPSILAQDASKSLYGIESNNTMTNAETKLKSKVYNEALNVLYNTEGLWGVSVCSQWPNDCGDSDSRFSDGAYTDNPAFLMNIAQYQRDQKYKNSQQPPPSPPPLLKFVLINPNYVTPTNNYSKYNDAIILGYFNTTFNVGIDPGNYIWSPGQPVPWPSTQIFEESMDADNLHSKFQRVEGTNWTTAILKGTTIRNPIYGVEGGQSIELFYFMINSFIPSKLVGTDDIQTYTIPLANLTYDIATNKDLQSKLKDFFFDDNDNSHDGDDINGSAVWVGGAEDKQGENTVSSSTTLNLSVMRLVVIGVTMVLHFY